VFVEIPKNVGNSIAFSSVKLAAQHRRWTIKEASDNKVVIYLNHRCYQSKLTFTIKDHVIYFDDSTKVYEGCLHPSYYQDGMTTTFGGDLSGSSNSSGKPEFVDAKVPPGWLKNLRQDATQNLMSASMINTGRQEESSDDKAVISSGEIEKKLKKLKSLFDQKLITEEEYEQKKKELLMMY